MRGIDVDAGNPYSLWSDDFVWNGLRELSFSRQCTDTYIHRYVIVRGTAKQTMLPK